MGGPMCATSRFIPANQTTPLRGAVVLTPGLPPALERAQGHGLFSAKPSGRPPCNPWCTRLSSETGIIDVTRFQGITPTVKPLNRLATLGTEDWQPGRPSGRGRHRSPIADCCRLAGSGGVHVETLLASKACAGQCRRPKSSGAWRPATRTRTKRQGVQCHSNPSFMPACRRTMRQSPGAFRTAHSASPSRWCARPDPAAEADAGAATEHCGHCLTCPGGYSSISGLRRLHRPQSRRCSKVSRPGWRRRAFSCPALAEHVLAGTVSNWFGARSSHT